MVWAPVLANRRPGSFAPPALALDDLALVREIEPRRQRLLGQAGHAQDLSGDGDHEPGAGRELDLAHRDQEILRTTEQGRIVGQRLLRLGDAHRELAEPELLQLVAVAR